MVLLDVIDSDADAVEALVDAALVAELIVDWGVPDIVATTS